MDEDRYLMPEYYPKFSCKMGACRASCCEGWQVTLSLEEYFRLLGLFCGPELRSELDVALRILDDPDPARYAALSRRYDGSCRLHMPDGRCALHAQVGGWALPEVCRLYPRAIHADIRECACAGSCEAVLEKLFALDGPLRFTEAPIKDAPPRSVCGQKTTWGVYREREIRLTFIRLAEDMSLPMPQRMGRIAGAMKRLDAALKAGDAAIDAFLSDPANDAPAVPEPSEDRLALGLRAMKALLSRLDERSQSLRAYGEAALAHFAGSGDPMRLYREACAHFDQIAPKWPLWLTNMLANHMFCARFPFAENGLSLEDELIALCAVYTLLRFLGVGWMADKDDAAPLVDVAAAAFRMMDHTPFHRTVSALLRGLGYSAPEALYALICL